MKVQMYHDEEKAETQAAVQKELDVAELVEELGAKSGTDTDTDSDTDTDWI